MMQHYDIDGLIQYGAEQIPGTEEVVNPAWRRLDKTVWATRQRLRKLQAKLGAALTPEGQAIQERAEWVQEIEAVQAALDEQKAARKATPRKVTLEQLPQAERPTQLLPLNKTLTDAVKMIAYRAETALVVLLRPHLAKEDEARALIRALFVASADLQPDQNTGTLTVRIHRMATPAHDRAIAALLEDLNQLAFLHPETNQGLVYALV